MTSFKTLKIKCDMGKLIYSLILFNTRMLCLHLHIANLQRDNNQDLNLKKGGKDKLMQIRVRDQIQRSQASQVLDFWILVESIRFKTRILFLKMLLPVKLIIDLHKICRLRPMTQKLDLHQVRASRQIFKTLHPK